MDHKAFLERSSAESVDIRASLFLTWRRHRAEIR